MTWRARAACLGKDANLWFPTHENFHRYEEARPICEACPVRGDCLESALAYPQSSDVAGMFGGMTVEERNKLRKARRAKQVA